MTRPGVRRAAIISAGALVASAGTLAIEAFLARGVERLPAFDRAQLDGLVGVGNGAGDGHGEPLRVVWLGDSTGDGVGASGPDSVLPRVVAAGLRRPISLTVLAHSGDRVADVLRDQVPQLAALRPQWVILCIGGNDVTHLTRRRAFRAQMDRVLSKIDAINPERVIVLGIGEFAATPLLAQPLRALAGVRADRLNADVRAAAGAHDALFIDIIDATGGAFTDDPKRYHARDGFHPSDAGYRLWADATLAAIRDAGW